MCPACKYYSEISFSKGCYWTVLFNWKGGRNSGTSHHFHCFLVFTQYIWTTNTWLSGMPFVVLTQHMECWSWATSWGKRCWVGVPSHELCDEDGRIRVRPLAPQDQHPLFCTPGLHWTAAFPGSAFISSLGASSIVALQMDCQTPSKSKVFGWFWFFLLLQWGWYLNA